jgi:predicted RNase H-like HicB family nuclease
MMRLKMSVPPKKFREDDNKGLGEAVMKYIVRIEPSDEGFAVSAPGLPGCHSQGATEEEALANIADAIREYLDVVQELAHSADAKTIEIEV